MLEKCQPVPSGESSQIIGTALQSSPFESRIFHVATMGNSVPYVQRQMDVHLKDLAGFDRAFIVVDDILLASARQTSTGNLEMGVLLD